MNEVKVVEQPNNIINYLSAYMHKDFSKKTEKAGKFGENDQTFKNFSPACAYNKKGTLFP